MSESPVILFVDDEPLILSGLGRMLRRERGWELCFAHSVSEALALMADRPVDAVVSDIDMPLQDGFDLLAAVLGNPDTRDIPVVILTGNAERTLKRRALDEGATDLLAKPVAQEDLIARLRSVLRLKAAQDEIKAHAANLERLVRQRTVALERARLELVWRLGKAGEFRDTETSLHVLRVGLFARELAREMGLEEGFCDMLFLTAPLHDIGKIGIPDAVLRKPGRLEAEEWRVMKEHTRIGASLLGEDVLPEFIRAEISEEVDSATVHNPFAEMGRNIALFHHERWDGTGYPEGLSGEQIPMEARITAVVDVFDALSSARVYKEAWPPQQVVDLLRRERGKHFQEELVDAFLTAMPRVQAIQRRFADAGEVPVSA